jgi:hypothetical protein
MKSIGLHLLLTCMERSEERYTDFLEIFSLCSSLSVRDQVSHPYKTTGIYCI